MHHRAEFTDEAPDSYLFTGTNASPIRSGNWRKRVFYPACERAGLSPIPHLHDCRHTAASLAIAAGAHPKALAEMLGHSNIAITMNLYSHVLPTLQKDMAAKLDSIYRVAL